jgi:phosphohistidine phosphatase
MPTSSASTPENHSVKYLWLLRHAKATAHGRRGGNDYDRPLTTRGRRDALALGNRLAAGVGVFGLEGVALPQLALTSSAARTSQTAALVAEGMEAKLPIDGYRSLYQAGTETILQYVREIDDDLTSAMVVGHNPTIYQLAWELLPGDGGGIRESGDSGDVREGGESGSDERQQLRDHGFSTCTVAVLVVPVASWSEVAEESASLAGVFSPPY